jgi:hypothetical protein
MLDLIRHTKTDDITRLANALVKTGPVVTDKATYSARVHDDGYAEVTMTTQVLSGFPHAQEVAVPAGV